MNRHLFVLKALGKKGALKSYITITSTELGRMIGVSQQTASNRILELLDEGLIERKVGTRHQRMKITRKGYDVLHREYADLQAMFKPEKKIMIKGHVATGLGEGRYYVAQYSRQFKDALGFKPFEGTLNLTVGEEGVQQLNFVPDSSIIEIKSFKADGRSFGKVKCIPAMIEDTKCAIVIPKRSHHNEVIEILARYNLRRTLKVGEGDELELVIDI